MKVARLPLLLCALALASSCGVVAGAGLGYVIHREVLPGAVHEAHIADDIERVWPLACETLDVLHDIGTEVTITGPLRHAEAKVNGSTVSIDVLAYDYLHTVVRVRAEGTFAADTKTAEKVLANVIERLERTGGGPPAEEPVSGVIHPVGGSHH